MTMDVIKSPTQDELRLYMRSPVWYQRKWLLQIETFIGEVLAFKFPYAAWGDGSPPVRDRFAFCVDRQNTNVPEPPHCGQPTAGEWIWRVMLSSRGPLITCQSYELRIAPEMNMDLPDKVYAFIETPPRAQAVEWTLRIAREFDLRYVDAKMLREWEISYDEVDPAFEDALEYIPNDEPNAFQVLFLET
jgi:hypothetical protein